ncbi:MAG: FtsX-like permease family protein [Eubacteriales bacterium]|nr:FtsX-like permease family protein [Eubacteriales bacterium]
MNFAKRAFLYISRKRGKTISLLFLIFIVAVFLISCFGVLNASERLSKDIRTSLGAAFYIRANTEVSMNENGESEVKKNSVNILQKEIDEIMETGEIKYCNPINYGYAKSEDIQFIPGEKHTEESNMGEVTALRFSALAPDFTDETAALIEGNPITETDNRKILISEQLASANHLSVGDVITLTHAKLGELAGAYIDEIPIKTAYVHVEVSGIYKLNIEDTAIKPTAGVAENEIYASLDVLNQLHESETGIYTGEVDFYITDPVQLESITRKVQLLPSIDWTTHFIRTNDFQYSKISDELQSLGGLVKILLVLVSIVSIAVLTLLLTMRIRGRLQEAGILLSVGISKKQILAQFLLEILSIAVLALGLSYIASTGVTKFLGYSLFGELQLNLLNEETLITGVKSGIQIENYLKLSGAKILLIYLCQFVVVTVSIFVSSISFMRLKPKEILSKMS